MYRFHALTFRNGKYPNHNNLCNHSLSVTFLSLKFLPTNRAEFNAPFNKCYSVLYATYVIKRSFDIYFVAIVKVIILTKALWHWNICFHSPSPSFSMVTSALHFGHRLISVVFDRPRSVPPCFPSAVNNRIVLSMCIRVYTGTCPQFGQIMRFIPCHRPVCSNTLLQALLCNMQVLASRCVPDSFGYNRTQQ